jgi:hypothetical protein
MTKPESLPTYSLVEYFHHFMTKNKIQCDSYKGQIVLEGGEVLKLPDFEEFFF